MIGNMFAKAVQGMPAEDAVKAAEAELKKIYASLTDLGLAEGDRRCSAP